jgi:hypothetical protein
MKISISHQNFANWLKDQDVLTNPEKYLGHNWKNVLNFWIYLDTIPLSSREDCELGLSPCAPTLRAAYDIIGSEYGLAAFNAHVGYAEGYATCELIASHKLESLIFLPLFLVT